MLCDREKQERVRTGFLMRASFNRAQKEIEYLVEETFSTPDWKTVMTAVPEGKLGLF